MSIGIGACSGVERTAAQHGEGEAIICIVVRHNKGVNHVVVVVLEGNCIELMPWVTKRTLVNSTLRARRAIDKGGASAQSLFGVATLHTYTAILSKFDDIAASADRVRVSQFVTPFARSVLTLLQWPSKQYPFLSELCHTNTYKVVMALVSGESVTVFAEEGLLVEQSSWVRVPPSSIRFFLASFCT